MQQPPDPPNPGTPGEVAALRERLRTALAELIYTPDPTLDGEQRPFSLHHTGLRQRTSAVEMLGRFPDAEAVTLLAELLLRRDRARALPRPLWQWLRDTALLTLLRSTRLPRPDVDQTLGRLYSITRHPWPWQWPAVYDDLALLAHYRKQGVFFRAFWLWPLLLGAIPTGALLIQLLWPAPVGGPILRSLVVVVGTGLEIYLIHQVLIALLAGARGPLLEVQGGSSIRWKAGIAGVIALLLIGAIVALMVSGSFTVISQAGPLGSIGLWGTAVLLPLVLLPLFILAHDLERQVRYAPRRHSWGLRLWTGVLRRATDALYILALPVIAAASWIVTDHTVLLVAIGVFLVYLFAVPFLVAGGLRVLSRVWHHDGTEGA